MDKPKICELTKSEVYYNIKRENIVENLTQGAVAVAETDIPKDLKNFIVNHLLIDAHLSMKDKITRTVSFNSIYEEFYGEIQSSIYKKTDNPTTEERLIRARFLMHIKQCTSKNEAIKQVARETNIDPKGLVTTINSYLRERKQAF